MSERTPNYILVHDVQLVKDQKTLTLPAGSFVRPVKTRYVPEHVQEANRWFNERTEVYCYTRIGIVPIERTAVRER